MSVTTATSSQHEQHAGPRAAAAPRRRAGSRVGDRRRPAAIAGHDLGAVGGDQAARTRSPRRGRRVAQRGGEGRAVGEPLGRVLGQRAADDGGQVGRDVGGQVGHRVAEVGQGGRDRRVGRRRAGARPGTRTRPRRGSRRREAGVAVPPLGLLGGEVLRGAHHLRRCR